MNIPSENFEIWRTDGEKDFNIGQGFKHRLKYVHQLQNLYFALTGKELKIKN